MPWTERQHAMLDAMGLRTWGAAVVDGQDEGQARVGVDSAQGPDGDGDQALPQDARPVVSLTSDAVQAGWTTGAASSIATMEWPTLRRSVAECTACGLCASRTQTVFGIGHEQAHWMIVGEAPGEQEDQRGEPFVGKSGLLLDAMLRAIGLTRQTAPAAKQVYIANTLKCRPPANRNPEPAELARCEPFLQRQVALVQPKIILAMGRFAVQSLLRSSEPIGRLRGQVHRYEGVPLVVTYHPAYLLRNPLDKARAWDDLCLAVETLAQTSARTDARTASDPP